MRIYQEVGSVLEQIKASCDLAVDANHRRKLDLADISLQYSWEEVVSATDDFSAFRRLGCGTYGSVYRGALRDGTGVAVKVIETPVGGGFEEEVRLLSLCRHPNVVMLLGFSRAKSDLSVVPAGHNNPNRRALVYELLLGGDLRSRIKLKNKSFLWDARVRTAIDVSRGLVHLHQHRPEIFHRDIKTQNILFSGDGTAKIGDFGLGCVAACRDARALASQVLGGTIGYVDPLYAQTGVISEATEMYSFGMVLLELMTGRPPASQSPDGRSHKFLLDTVKPSEGYAKQRLLEMLDINADWPKSTAASLATLSFLCIHDDEERRPSFLELATMLQDLVGDLASKGLADARDSEAQPKLSEEQIRRAAAACRGQQATNQLSDRQHISKHGEELTWDSWSMDDIFAGGGLFGVPSDVTPHSPERKRKGAIREHTPQRPPHSTIHLTSPSGVEYGATSLGSPTEVDVNAIMDANSNYTFAPAPANNDAIPWTHRLFSF